jgi:hypothetical protein
MPLPTPAERSLIHARRIECQGFRRTDGLWDIEAHLLDTKTHAWLLKAKGELPAGAALHAMALRMTIDDGFIVRDIIALTEASPFPVCPEITGAFSRLVGSRIGPGWRKQVNELLGGIQGCTHLVELLGPIATVAFQTLAPFLEHQWPGSTKPPHFDACHALRTDGETVKQYYPQWYDGKRVFE